MLYSVDLMFKPLFNHMEFSFKCFGHQVNLSNCVWECVYKGKGSYMYEKKKLEGKGRGERE